MNRVQLIGRLTADPEGRTSTDGTPLTHFRLAVPRSANREEAVFVSVVCFERLALVAAEHLTKGRRVAVDGRLDQREWIDSDGRRHDRHGVVADAIDFLDAPDRVPEAEPAAA
jgi:single-strand DNA-binding protein